MQFIALKVWCQVFLTWCSSWGSSDGWQCCILGRCCALPKTSQCTSYKLQTNNRTKNNTVASASKRVHMNVKLGWHTYYLVPRKRTTNTINHQTPEAGVRNINYHFRHLYVVRYYQLWDTKMGVKHIIKLINTNLIKAYDASLTLLTLIQTLQH